MENVADIHVLIQVDVIINFLQVDFYVANIAAAYIWRWLFAAFVLKLTPYFVH